MAVEAQSVAVPTSKMRAVPELLAKEIIIIVLQAGREAMLARATIKIPN